MNASRHLLSDKHRMDTAQLAAIYERHKHEPDSDVMRLWQEVDALRFELAGAAGRAQRVIEEKEAVERRMYLVLAKVPGAGMAV